MVNFNRRFARPSKYPKNLHRPLAESSDELDDAVLANPEAFRASLKR